MHVNTFVKCCTGTLANTLDYLTGISVCVCRRDFRILLGGTDCVQFVPSSMKLDPLLKCTAAQREEGKTGAALSAGVCPPEVYVEVQGFHYRGSTL